MGDNAGSEAEARIEGLRGQVQDLALRCQKDMRRQAGLLDAYFERLYIVHYRTEVLAELLQAQIWARSKLATTRPPCATRHRPLTGAELLVAFEKLVPAELFSPEWYRGQESAAANLSNVDTLKHFLTVGLAEGRDPHPLVSMSWVAGQQTSGGKAPILALMDKNAGIDPHPLFDTQFYLRHSPDVLSCDGTPFQHYLAFGAAEGRQPHAAFEPAWYLRQLPGEWKRPDNPLLHYVTSPSAFYLDPHPLFDASRYLRALDTFEPINPLVHFLTVGERGGRRPHPLFEPDYYLFRHADVAAAGLSPFTHFLRHGSAEHRIGHPLFEPSAYARLHGEIPEAVADPLRHYIVNGAREGLATGSPILTPKVLTEILPNLDVSTSNPLVAFQEGWALSLDVSAHSVGATTEGEQCARPDDTPPPPVETFSLPQRLREYVDNRFGEAASRSLRDLMAVVDRYGERPNTFAVSQSCADLRARLRAASGEPVGEPSVSIIIPVHNALVYTLTCVVAILECETRHTFEIIVGDDASTDATPDIFSDGLGRVARIHHRDNLGFLANCNATAEAARGRHLVFLNNDTLVMPGWLDSLVDLADREHDVGLIGSKLLNPDGTLQEAGGIVWNDGSAWNFGRGEDPNAPAYNFVRDVDYCSGASLLIPMRVWSELDGFNREFMPAYCEDSDFAFRARAVGYRTLYQPFSELVHHEGRSHGRDENQGIKQYQTINADKLFACWRETLARENFANGEQVFFARDRSRHRTHLLVVDHYVPQWDRDAGSRTMYNFLRAFVDRGVHVIFWSDNLYQDPVYTRPLQELGIEVLYGSAYVGQFERWFFKHQGQIPYVLLSRPHISIKFIETIKRHSKTTIMYYGHDLHSRRLQDEYEVSRSEEVARLAREYGDLEMRIWRMSDVILYPSESERATVDGMLDGQRAVLTIPAWTFDLGAIDAAASAPMAARMSHDLLFVGGFAHGPNVDGVTWFASEVMPLLLAYNPGFRLTIVGSNAPPAVLALESAAIRILGFVDDNTLMDLYARAGVAVAPLRFGGGVKGKVIEAFSKGIPVVTTSVGVQGIPGAETLAFIADTPADFAAAVVTAAEEHDGAGKRASAATAFVRREYTADKLIDQLTPHMPELARPAAA